MKKLFKIFSLLLFSLLLGGCVKYRTTLTINPDSSVDYQIIYAIKNEYASQMGDNKEELSKFKDNGYVIDNYITEEYTGYKISKHFISVDEIANSDLSKADLYENNDDKFFKVEKGFFKNIYSANLTSSESNEINEQAQMYDDSEEYSEQLSAFDMKFTLKLPYKVISSNATKVSEDKKTLTWDLTKSTGNIEFKFAIYNTNNIILVIGISLIIIAGLAALIRHLSKTKHRLYMSGEKKK